MKLNPRTYQAFLDFWNPKKFYHIDTFGASYAETFDLSKDHPIRREIDNVQGREAVYAHALRNMSLGEYEE